MLQYPEPESYLNALSAQKQWLACLRALTAPQVLFMVVSRSESAVQAWSCHTIHASALHIAMEHQWLHASAQHLHTVKVFINRIVNTGYPEH